MAALVGGLAVLGGLASVPLLNAQGSQRAAAKSVGAAAQNVQADTQLLKRLTIEALIIQQTLGSDQSKVVWAVRDISRVPIPDSHAIAKLPLLSAGQIEARRAWWHAKINERFSGSAVRGRLEYGLANMIAAAKDPNARELGGGVSKVAFTSVLAGPHTAELTATADEWVESAYRAAPGSPWGVSRPEGPSNVDIKFVKSATGQWTIEDMVQSFANGSGP